MGRDAKVAAERAAREALARAAADPPLPAPAAARRIRANPCPRCGGHKRTEPRTAYVYCDYCAALFDYDLARARADTGAADRAVFELLVDGVRDELRRAFAARDDAAYRAAWRWPYEKDMELCPSGWSPRIGDPAYRDGMVAFSVETCVLHNRDERRRALAGKVREAQAGAQLFPSRAASAAYVAALRALFDHEASALARGGALALHPDELDADTYRRVNLAIAVYGWRGPDPDGLRRLAGLDAGTVELGATPIDPASCGQCGGRLLVVDGARQQVCEACGQRVARVAGCACPSCAAPLLAAAGARDAVCAWCDARFPVVAS